MHFTDIPGLDETKALLKKSVETGHLAHAQLFLGEEGGANLAMAVAYASEILNLKPAADEKQFIHPDLHFSFPYRSTVKKEPSDHFIVSWRSFLLQHIYGNLDEWAEVLDGENKQLIIPVHESRNIIKKLSLRAFGGDYKVVIIWKPELLNPPAANALLKIIEEPPEKTVFLLVANDIEQLLPTILSRTQVVNIPLFSSEEMIAALTAKGYGRPESESAALLAAGNMRQALQLVNEVDDRDHILFRTWMRNCYQMNFSKLRETLDTFARLGKMKQINFLHYGLTMMRETMFAEAALSNQSDEPFALHQLQGEELNFVTNFSKIMNPEKLAALIQLLSEAIEHIERNASPKITIMDVSLRINRLIK